MSFSIGRASNSDISTSQNTQLARWEIPGDNSVAPWTPSAMPLQPLPSNWPKKDMGKGVVLVTPENKEVVRAYLKSNYTHLTESQINFFMNNRLIRGAGPMGKGLTGNVYHFYSLDAFSAIGKMPRNQIDQFIAKQEKIESEQRQQVIDIASTLGFMYGGEFVIGARFATWLKGGSSSGRLAGLLKGGIRDPRQRQAFARAADAALDLKYPGTGGRLSSATYAATAGLLSYSVFNNGVVDKNKKFNAVDALQFTIITGLTSYFSTALIGRLGEAAVTKGSWWRYGYPTVLGGRATNMDILQATVFRFLLAGGINVGVQGAISVRKNTPFEVNWWQAAGASSGNIPRMAISWRAAMAAPNLYSSKIVAYRIGFPVGQAVGSTIGGVGSMLSQPKSNVDKRISEYWNSPGNTKENVKVPLIPIYQNLKGEYVLADGTKVDDFEVKRGGATPQVPVERNRLHTSSGDAQMEDLRNEKVRNPEYIRLDDKFEDSKGGVVTGADILKQSGMTGK
jgi:hypothetical protein